MRQAPINWNSQAKLENLRRRVREWARVRARAESQIDSPEKESGAKTNLSKATLAVLSIVRSSSARSASRVFHTAASSGVGTNDDRMKLKVRMKNTLTHSLIQDLTDPTWTFVLAKTSKI